MAISSEQQRAVQQYRNAVNNAQGHSFEDYIKAACTLYSQQGRAEIEKTPEPFRVTAKNRKDGTFSGRFTARAQPDFQGTLDGGRSIVFEAKYTMTDRMKRAVLTDEQMKRLKHHHERGALAAVCVGIQNDFFFVPWLIWDDMKNLYGRQYVTADDLKELRVKFNGSVLFLDYVGSVGGRWISGADCSPDGWRMKGGAKGE